MVSPSTSEEIFNKIREDPTNLSCVDCGNEEVTFASISHGSFICEACANKHKSLGPNISFVKPLNDSWSIRQLKIMTAGGNSTLKNFFSSYTMPPTFPIDVKYNTLAAKYYREMLKVMAEGEPCNMPTPSIDEGLMLIQETPPVKLSEAKPEPENNSYIGSIFGSAYNMTMGISKNIYGKVKEIETYKNIETKVVENAYKVGESLKWGAQKGVEIGKGGIEWGAQKGFENLEWGKKSGLELGSKGVNFLKTGAFGAIDGMTSAAAHSYEKINLGERTKKLKEETMSILTTIEKNTVGKVIGRREEQAKPEEEEENKEAVKLEEEVKEEEKNN